MNSLIVYLNAERVGILDQDDSGLLQFSYDQAWLAKPGAMPLSRSLPLQSEIFPGKKARPFFAGVLSEERPRKRIAEILGISDTNDFAMLERIGGECAGAQDKLPVIVHNNGICLPLDNSPSTHILKPEPDHFPGLVANEIFCMTRRNRKSLP